jgi:hypothetical protein
MFLPRDTRSDSAYSGNEGSKVQDEVDESTCDTCEEASLRPCEKPII